MSADIKISATGDAKGMAPLNRSITELKAELLEVKKAFEQAKPNSSESQKAVQQAHVLNKAIREQYEALDKGVKALQEKEAAEKAAAAATLKAAEAERAARAEVQKRFDLIMKTSAAEKENRRVAAMGNPWTTSSRTAVAEMEKQQAAANARVAAMGNPWTTASRGYTPPVSGGQATPANAAAKGGANAPESAAKAGGNMGHSMLLLGQALEDAQYGLRGVMNNIPGLVTSFGLGAGAAGGLQIGLVALSQVLDIVKGKMAETAKVPPIQVLNFDQEQEKRAKDFLALMDRVTDAIKRRNAAMQEGYEAQVREMEFQQAYQKILDQRADRDFVSTGDPVQDAFAKEREALNRIQRDAEARREGRLSQVSEGDAKSQAARGDLARADAAYQAQQQFIQGVEKRSAMQMVEKDLKAELIDLTRQAQGKYVDPFKDFTGFLKDVMDHGVDREPNAEAGRTIAAKAAQLEALQKELAPGALPALPGFTPTGDAEKDRETQQRLLDAEKARLADLKKYREAALQTAEEAEKNAALNRDKLNKEQTLDDLQTQDQVLATEATRQGAVDTAMNEQAQAEGGAAVGDVVAGLNDLMGMAKTDAARQTIADLKATLTDADGATMQDLQAVAAYVATITSAVPDVVQKVAQVGNRTVDAISNLNSIVSSWGGRITALEASLTRSN